MQRKHLVEAARDLNKVMELSPEIDIAGSSAAIKDSLLEASELLTEKDAVHSSTRDVIKALKAGDTVDNADHGGDAGDTKTATTTTAKPKAKAEAKAKEPKPPAEPKVRVFKKDTLVYRLKVMLLKNPALTSDELSAALVKEGFKPGASTVGAFRQDFLHSLRVLKNNGHDIPGIEA